MESRRIDEPLIQSLLSRNFASVSADNFGRMLEMERYLERSSAFDRAIGASDEHSWSALDPRYLNFEEPFDIQTTPLIDEEHFLCLRTPSVRRALPSHADRAGFINRIVWVRFSSLLHGEQGALNLAASLCAILHDQGAQEFAANQVREEARHVTAFARYIKHRWGRPAPCIEPLQLFLSSIIESGDISKKIIGMQIMVEGLAMGTLGALYKRLRDPLGQRLIQLVMTDEAFHHKFGKAWADEVIPNLGQSDLDRVQNWTQACLRDFIVKMNPPVELAILKADYGLDPVSVAREMQEIPKNERLNDTALGVQETLRVMVNTLNASGLLPASASRMFLLGTDITDILWDQNDEIVQGGIEYLQSIRAARSQHGRGVRPTGVRSFLR